MLRTVFAAVFGLVMSTSSALADEVVIKEVEAQLKVLNEAFTNGGNPAKLKELMTADHLAITPWGGTQTRDEQLKTLPELKLEEYKAGPTRIVALGKDGALITYSLKMKGTFRGKAVPTDSFATAVWVRRDGKWYELHYQETAK